MSTDKQEIENVVTPKNDETIEDNVKNLDPFKKLAKKYGFDPTKGKTEEEWVEYALANLPQKVKALETQNQQLSAKDQKLSELEITLNQIASDMKKQKELGYQQALADFKLQRQEAIKAGDPELVSKIETDQAKFQEDYAKQVDQDGLKQQLQNEILVKNFHKANPWASGKSIEELEMQAYARQLEQTMIAKQMPLEEQLETIDTAVRRKFPDAFKETPAASAVEGGGQSIETLTKGKKTYTFNDLNAEQKVACKFYVDKKYMSTEEYIAQLIEQGDLK